MKGVLGLRLVAQIDWYVFDNWSVEKNNVLNFETLRRKSNPQLLFQRFQVKVNRS